jgi:hexosaminidase
MPAAAPLPPLRALSTALIAALAFAPRHTAQAAIEPPNPAPATAVAPNTAAPAQTALPADPAPAHAPAPDSEPPTTLKLMPVPASIRVDSGRFVIDSSFSAAITRYRNARLRRGVERALRRLAARTGVTLATTAAPGTAGATAALVVDVKRAGEAVQSVAEDESYTLDVSPGKIVLAANTVVGALRGLETLLQLVQGDTAGYVIPFVHIADRPRFPWRGLLIDVSRHWEPVSVIERNLDAMAMVKLNVLHWHLSDDQGFRVESRRYPKLQGKGSDSLYYTQQEIREVVAYARDRGIRVVPEFDMPGHATSWLVGYPHLGSAPGPYEITRNFGAGTGELDPTRESVYQFIDRFVGEMATLFPDGSWHIGGDEVMGKQWQANPAIRRFMRRNHFKDNAALQAYFNRRLSRILRAHHKQMVGWDEILRPDLPKSTIVQSWRNAESLASGAKAGFRGILSAGYYLDAMQPADAHYMVDPIPLGSDLDSAQAGRVLGGEACMWGELVTPENIDSRIWPRTAAIAERLWSPRAVTDVRDMYRRLRVVSVELEEAGVMHLAGPGIMLRRLAPGGTVEPLAALLSLTEPLALGPRMRTRRPTQQTPLTAPGDIVRPDAQARRAIERMVDSLLRDAPRYLAYRDSLAQRFAQWRALAPQVAALAARSPEIRGADSVAADLAELGAAGEEALRYLSEGASAPQEWLASKLAVADRAAVPKGLLKLTVVSAVRTLIIAAGGEAASGQ